MCVEIFTNIKVFSHFNIEKLLIAIQRRKSLQLYQLRNEIPVFIFAYCKIYSKKRGMFIFIRNFKLLRQTAFGILFEFLTFKRFGNLIRSIHDFIHKIFRKEYRCLCNSKIDMIIKFRIHVFDKLFVS